MNYESFISTLKTKFKTLLDAQIDIINTARTDIVVPKITKFIEDFPDTVKYTDNVIFYVLPVAYNYQPLTNSSRELTVSLNIYITAKGYTTDTLTKMVYRYMEAFSNAIEDNTTLSGFVDIIYIDDMKYYNDIEGTNNYKAFEANLKAVLEV